MYKNILVPIILDEEHDTQASFLVARALAAEDAQFTILHVMEQLPAYATARIPRNFMDQSREHIEKLLKLAARALPDARAEMIEGHAGRAIVDYAEANGIDCIVLASHRPGIENIFLGSTASRVVRHAKCAVHVIR